MPRPLYAALSDEDDVQLLTSRNTPRRDRSTSSTCTLGRVEEADFQELFDEEIIDLTVDDTVSARGGFLKPGEHALSSIRARGFLIQPGGFVEVINTHLGGYEIDFVQVKIIAQKFQTGLSIIRGIPFVRTPKLKAQLPLKLNEVCKILHFNRDSNNEDSPLLVDAPIESILQRRTLVTTNALYPAHSIDTSHFRHIFDKAARDKEMKLSGPLACRWQLKIYFTVQGRRTKPEEEALTRIESTDVEDRRFCVSDEALCVEWRDGRMKGGSWSPGDNIGISAPSRSTTRGEGQKYTVFDSFSGAGGLSRGAQSAGFKIKFALDHAKEVWGTYSINFPDTRLYKMSVDKFIRLSKRKTRVDILHLSPPCQYFSPAHTHEAAHDDDNIFALFGCRELINRTRPRLVTLEQTFGLTHERHQLYFRPLIGDFTQLGYSVRWKVVRLCTWGSAQDRKRLILIAAGPGEKLPPFPKATHSETGGHGLKPCTTIRQAIGGVRIGDDAHDLDSAKRHHPRRAPYDPERLAMTITTGGGDAYYPDGTRDFTLRELASLQGFPRNHQFRGNRTSVKKQIGNAFPPNTVRVLYSHLEEWLLKQDGMRRHVPPINDVVSIDEDVVMIEDDSSDESMPDYSSYSEHGESPDIEDDVMEVGGPSGVRAEMHRKSMRIIDLT